MDTLTRPPVDPAVDLPTQHPGTLARILTAVIVVGPLGALALAIVRLWGHGIHVRDVIIAVMLYAVIGHGIAIGYHRLFTHRSFKAVRALRIGLAVAGSMAFEGGPVGWVADHRRHHAHTDRAGDPHSPHAFGPGVMGQLRGLWHAHTGWLFTHSPTDTSVYAEDIIADRDLRLIDRLFPVWCIASLVLPFSLGLVLSGWSLGAGITALLWAGLVRICVLHHVTWSVNSICHMFGRRPFRTKDHSGNVAVLSVLSFGESWHNGHHAFPMSARLGLQRFQVDSSAMLIRGFERLGWAFDVGEPDAALLARKRIS
jgi:stearoyl-CoA desaturase (Delta-9 desaturase)